MSVASLFSEVVGVERGGTADNCFVLGDDSLRGMQLLARLRALHGVRIPPAALFRKLTVAGFTREIGAADAGTLEASVVPPLARCAQSRQ